MSFVEILKIATEHGLSPLNIVLIGMVYFLGAHSGLFPKFWKTTEDEEDAKVITFKDLHQEVKKLQGYFNHETTAKLIKLSNTQDEIAKGVKKTVELSYDLKRKHEEYDKYGIKTQKEL